MALRLGSFHHPPPTLLSCPKSKPLFHSPSCVLQKTHVTKFSFKCSAAQPSNPDYDQSTFDLSKKDEVDQGDYDDLELEWGEQQLDKLGGGIRAILQLLQVDPETLTTTTIVELVERFWTRRRAEKVSSYFRTVDECILQWIVLRSDLLRCSSCKEVKEVFRDCFALEDFDNPMYELRYDLVDFVDMEDALANWPKSDNSKIIRRVPPNLQGHLLRAVLLDSKRLTLSVSVPPNLRG